MDIKERVKNSLVKIKTVPITDKEGVSRLITELPLDTDIGRYRAPFLYRGLPNSGYDLVTSLQRNCKERSAEQEGPLLRHFAKYAIEQDPQITESIWRQMVLGQHHGLPTRLMDWTCSPLVALHFAVSAENPADIDKTDCVIWRINGKDIRNKLPPSYENVLLKRNAHIFTVDMLQECAKSLEDYDTAMKDHNSLVIMEPPSIDQRIISQYSYFTVMPSHIDCFEEYMVKNMPNTIRYVISKNLRWQIRDLLDQMNVSERTLLPGFDGIAAWLKRFHYVK